MYNIMIDLETVGLERTSAIAQIGMVLFNYDFKILNEFLVNVDVKEQLDKVSTFDQNTLTWWQSIKQKDPSLYNSVFKNTKSCDDAFIEMQDWLKNNTLKNNEGFRLWSNHLLFDVPISNHFMGYYGDNWKEYVRYNSFEDFATVRNTAKRLNGSLFNREKSIEMPSGSAHNALYDCIWQTKSLELCYDLLGVKL